MFEPGSRPAIFLQPHSDDVALSCGGTAAASAATGAFTHILSVFSGQVLPQMVGRLAQQKHERWNLHDVDVLFETRRAEDAQAVKALGCTIRWLGMPDAIYRGDRYPSNDELFGPLHDEEYLLADHLVEEIEHLPEWRDDAVVFVPLAIGDHVDHQVLFQVGRLLNAGGYTVFAYEDTPYVIHSPEGLDRRLSRIGLYLGSPVEVNIAATLDARIEAIAAYASQVPVLFRFTDDWRGAVRHYACQRGGGIPAERFWPIIG